MTPSEHPPAVARQLRRLYAEKTRSGACRATCVEEFTAWQRNARAQFGRLLGIDRIAADCGSHVPGATADPPEDLDGYTRQHMVLQTEPDVHLDLWLLKPKTEGPHPLAITPHGHESGDAYVGLSSTPEEAERIRQEERDVAVQAVRRGFLALAPATRGLGSGYTITDIARRHSGRDCVCHNWQVCLSGRTLMGERVWDMQCLLDWALALPDVDGRVLMLGNSGGGMTTLHAAAWDERVQIAVPCCAFNNYVSPEGTMRHCPCNAIPGILELGEFWDVAALLAPRHLLTVNGRLDPLHPVAEVDAAARRLSRLYATAGAPEAYEHRFGPAGHRFYAELMWPWVETRMGGLHDHAKTASQY